ncbi:hypothetical protein [Roseobacter denitrificans]|uniref:hypothetical protein n=1 Tax=Roseobacter denitrificans TaxID=2434 RepID=UPI0002E74F72|nr:hypothetical protein [Roseobacter denitrificans]
MAESDARTRIIAITLACFDFAHSDPKRGEMRIERGAQAALNKISKAHAHGA